jgi:hypothetical protein
LIYKARTISIADAHRGDGKRFIVRVGKKLMQPESGTQAELS